jgi:hypothetical protein
MAPFARWNLSQLSNYEQEWKEMEEQSREEYIGSLRRYSNSSRLWQVVLSDQMGWHMSRPKVLSRDLTHSVLYLSHAGKALASQEGCPSTEASQGSECWSDLDSQALDLYWTFSDSCKKISETSTPFLQTLATFIWLNKLYKVHSQS